MDSPSIIHLKLPKSVYTVFAFKTFKTMADYKYFLQKEDVYLFG